MLQVINHLICDLQIYMVVMGGEERRRKHFRFALNKLFLVLVLLSLGNR